MCGATHRGFESHSLRHDDDEAAWRSRWTRPRPRSAHGDVPVGAVVVRDGEVIARRHNERELRQDPTAHAEMLALQDAAAGARHLAARRLHARRHPRAVRDVRRRRRQSARIGRLVYGAADLKAGATASLYNVCADPRLNHNPPVTHGVLAAECGVPARPSSSPVDAPAERRAGP